MTQSRLAQLTGLSHRQAPNHLLRRADQREYAVALLQQLDRQRDHVPLEACEATGADDDRRRAAGGLQDKVFELPIRCPLSLYTARSRTCFR